MKRTIDSLYTTLIYSPRRPRGVSQIASLHLTARVDNRQLLDESMASESATEHQHQRCEHTHAHTHDTNTETSGPGG